MMSNVKHFPTLEEVIHYTEQFLKEYDPRGYGSNVKISYDLVKCTWVVEVFRYASCD